MAAPHDRAHAILRLALAVALILLLAACSNSPAAPSSGAAAAPAQSNAASAKAEAPTSGYPKQGIEYTVAGAAGGGIDATARGVEGALTKEKLYSQPITVNYIDGAAGTPAMVFLDGKKDNGYVQVFNTNRLYLNNLLDRTPLGIKDFTPLARIAADYEVIAVLKNSPYKTLKDMIDALKKDPKAVTFGHGQVPNDDQLMLLRMAKATGIDGGKINGVALGSGKEVMAAFLGGHVDAVATSAADVIEQVKAGDARILAVSSPERLKGDFGVAPTFKEQGIDVVLHHWRGIFGPKNMPKDAFDFWSATYTKMIQTPTWQATLDKFGWSNALLIGNDFGKALEEEQKTTEELLQPLGILPAKKN